MRTLSDVFRERRAQPLDAGVGWSDPSAIPPNSAYSRQLAGVVVNDTTALQIMSVMACLRLISNTVSQLPLDSFVRKNGMRIPVDPSPQIVAEPFVDVTREEGFQMGILSLMLRGNAYYHVLARDRMGWPILLDPLPPHLVLVRRVGGQVVYKVNHVEVPAEDIIHLRWMTLPGGIVGLSPVEYAAQGMGIALASEAYGSRFFAQGATLSGVLQTDQTLTKESAKRIAEQWRANHAGVSQSHMPLITDGGVKWSPIQVPPDQAQFLATRQFQRGEIAMLYGVPPHLIGDVDRTTSWGSGIQDQKIDFITFTLAQYTSRFEAAWNAMTPNGIFHKFNYDALLRTNTLARYQAYSVARTMGFMSTNEIRALEDMSPIDDPIADTFTQPLNSAQNGSVALNFGPADAPPPSSGSAK